MFGKALMGFGVCLALLCGGAAGQTNVLPSAERIVWPKNVWARGTVPDDSASEVQSLLDEAMSAEQSDVMGETRQIVVIHKGRLVAEDYREGFGPETKLVSWSMAKSITQALVGRAVQEGRIEDIDAPMSGPWEAGDPRAAITWRQWMTMTDGLDYSEVGETDLAKNDVVQMMFGPGRFDMVGYVKGLEQIHAAGAHWNYSTAAYHTISRALQWAVIGNFCGYLDCFRDYNFSDDWLNEALFTPLGMDAQPEFDAAGTFLGWLAGLCKRAGFCPLWLSLFARRHMGGRAPVARRLG